jgi:hypothetical protein
MIQPIQTLYYLLFYVTTSILFFYSALILKDGTEFYFMQSQVYTIILGLSTALTLLSVVSYKKKTKSVCCWQIEYHIKFDFIRIVCISFTKSIWETPAVSEKGIGMFLPVLAIVFLVLIRRSKGWRSCKICGQIEVNL